MADDLLQGHKREARDRALKIANEAYKQGNRSLAAEKFQQAAELTFYLADRVASAKVERQMKQDAQRYRQLAQNLSEAGPDGGPTMLEPATPGSGGNNGATPATTGGNPGQSSAGAQGEFGEIINGLVHMSTVAWDDIGGLDDTKADIKYTLGVSLAKPPDGVKIGLWRNVLFYGPPGTGKTLLAAATSSAIKTERGQSLFFNVKVSSIMSKYFGESSRILSQLYGTAREHSPAVVFLDEFESLSPKRTDETTGAERRVLSTLLAELDGLAEKGRRDIFVLTIAATNRPWDIDSAILSRFEKKILIPLPDPVSRESILRIQLAGNGFQLEGSYAPLVEATNGYSGREIERVCKEAVGAMIAEQNKEIPGLVDRGLDQVRGHQLKVRPLALRDFTVALDRTTPATSPAEMERYREWREQTEA